MDAPPEFPLRAIAGLSEDGTVYRAFNYLVAYRHGELLLVPVAMGGGDLRRVVDRCPIPWEEVCAVLDSPPEDPTPLSPEVFARNLPAVAAWRAEGWTIDHIALGASPRRVLKRYVHFSGVRFARLRK